MRARLLACAVVVLVASASPGAWADPPSDADTAIEHGVELRKEGKDAEALAEFQRAYALLPSPRARAQIGLAELALGRWVEAERDLEEALRAKDDAWIARYEAPLRKSLEIARPHLGWLEVDANVPGAELDLNGARVATLPMASPARVVAGSVVVEVRAPGYVPVRRPIEVAPGTRMRESVTLVPEETATPTPPKPAHEPAPPPAAPPSGGGELRAAAFVAGGVGLVGLGLGGWFGVQTLLAKSDRDAHCSPAGCDPTGLSRDHDARRDATISTIGFGVGIAGAIASAVLFWRAGRASVAFAPTTGGVGGVAVATGSF